MEPFGNTYCREICQHPSCWDAHRLESRGLMQFSPKTAGHLSSDYEELPVQHIVNLFDDTCPHNESPEQSSVTREQREPVFHRTDLVKSHSTDKCLVSNAVPSLNVDTVRTNHLNTAHGSARHQLPQQQSSIGCVEIHELFNSKEIYSKLNEAFMSKSYYVWVNPKKTSRKPLLPVNERPVGTGKMVVKDLTELLVTDTIHSRQHTVRQRTCITSPRSLHGKVKSKKSGRPELTMLSRKLEAKNGFSVDSFEKTALSPLSRGRTLATDVTSISEDFVVCGHQRSNVEAFVSTERTGETVLPEADEKPEPIFEADGKKSNRENKRQTSDLRQSVLRRRLKTNDDVLPPHLPALSGQDLSSSVSTNSRLLPPKVPFVTPASTLDYLPSPIRTAGSNSSPIRTAGSCNKRYHGTTANVESDTKETKEPTSTGATAAPVAAVAASAAAANAGGNGSGGGGVVERRQLAVQLLSFNPSSVATAAVSHQQQQRRSRAVSARNKRQFETIAESDYMTVVSASTVRQRRPKSDTVLVREPSPPPPTPNPEISAELMKADGAGGDLSSAVNATTNEQNLPQSPTSSDTVLISCENKTEAVAEQRPSNVDSDCKQLVVVPST